MNNQCVCESRTSELCCPGDKMLRRKWLSAIEKEHKPLTLKSKEIVRKLKLFSNSQRLEILMMLEQREHCMDEMARKLRARKTAVSYHLGLLKKQGFICVRRRSRFAFYSICEEGKNAVALFKSI